MNKLIVLKRLMFLYISVPLLINNVMATDSVSVVSKIKKVTVFLDGAQITRKAKINLTTGTTELTLPGLSYYVSANSIQVTGNTDYTIISVSQGKNFVDDKTATSELVELKKDIDAIKLQMQVMNGKKNVYNYEKTMILANQDVSGSRVGVNIETVMDLADYYSEKLKEIEFKLLENNKALLDAQKELTNLNKQYSELNGNGKKWTSEIYISLTSSHTQTTNIEVSYIVTNAGWIPLYDVRSDEINGPIKLTCKANVYQNTGVDWNMVDLSLSTGNPTISGTKPILSTWVLQFYEPISYKGAFDSRVTQSEVPSEEKKLEEITLSSDKEQDVEGYATTANYTQVNKGTVNTNYEIAIPYTIPGDNKPYSVEIQDYELPVEYRYSSVPKYDKDAFLMARISGWDKYNLLPGEANVFFQGTYVGKSYLSTDITTDTMDLSLGRDKGVIINRKKVKDYSKTAVIGSNKKVTMGIEIEIRNNKSVPIQLILDDQFPISSNKSIEIELLDNGGAKVNEQTGKLEWELNFKPSESKLIKFTYTVKYPKNSALNNF